MNKNYNYALTAVLEETGIDKSQLRALSLEREGKFYHVAFCTDWQRYEAYVEADSFAVVGLDFQPWVDELGARVKRLYIPTVA